MLLQYSTTSSPIPHVASVPYCTLYNIILYSFCCYCSASSSIPYGATVLTRPLLLMLLKPHQPYPLFLMLLRPRPLFHFLLQYKLTLSSLCCYNLILYYSLLLHHPLIPLLLLYNVILYSLCFFSTNSSSISPVVTTSYSNTYITTTFSWCCYNLIIYS